MTNVQTNLGMIRFKGVALGQNLNKLGIEEESE